MFTLGPSGRINGLWFGSLFPDSPKIFLDDAQLAQLRGGFSRVFFVTGSGSRLAYLQRADPAYWLAKSGGKLLYSNRPADISMTGAN